MAYGSCRRCGNAREECECPGAPTEARIDLMREKNNMVIQKMTVTAEEISRFITKLRSGRA